MVYEVLLQRRDGSCQRERLLRVLPACSGALSLLPSDFALFVPGFWHLHLFTALPKLSYGPSPVVLTVYQAANITHILRTGAQRRAAVCRICLPNYANQSQSKAFLMVLFFSLGWGGRGGADLPLGELKDGSVCDLTCSQLMVRRGNSCSALKVPVCRDTGHSIRIQSWPSLLSPLSASEIWSLVASGVSPKSLPSGLGGGCSANHRKFAQQKCTISPARAGVGEELRPWPKCN